MNQYTEERAENTETALDVEIQWGQLEKIRKFQKLSYAELARLSSIPERTLRNILNGMTKDPRVSTVVPIFRVLAASFDRISGLAPMRDFTREEAVYDATLMDSMRQQVTAAKEEIAVRDRELDRLRKLVLEKEGAMCRFEGRATEVEKLTKQCADQQERLEFKAEKIREQAETIASRDATIKEQCKNIENLEKLTSRQHTELFWLKIVIAGLVVIILAASVYLTWELANQDAGKLQWRK